VSGSRFILDGNAKGRHERFRAEGLSRDTARVHGGDAGWAGARGFLPCGTRCNQGELLKLEISVSATTVANVLRASGLGPATRRIGPSWSEFMRAQAQSMLGGGLRSEPAREFEGNVAARSAPPPKGTAGGVKAKEHATNGAEQPCSSPVRGLPRLSPGAAVPFLNDSTAAPLRSSQQWHARDGPSARDGPRTHRRSLHARTLRSPFQSKPSAARAGARRRNHGLALPERGCETLHPAAAARGNERGAEPAVEPSFFTPHGELLRLCDCELIRRSCETTCSTSLELRRALP
jgi:hypothetical protein